MPETPVYIELTATVVPLEPFRDVFIAHLGELGFDTFTDTEDGFQAYILKDLFSSDAVAETLQWDGVQVTYVLQEIEQVNWNAEWEKTLILLMWTVACTSMLLSTRQNKAMSTSC